MKRPFRDGVDSLIQLLTDMSILVLIFVYSLINEVDDTEKYNEGEFKEKGDLICLIITVSNSLIAIIALIQSVFKLSKMIRNSSKKKDQVEVFV